ncbi:MAG: hypothetical protein Kow00122_14220 [Thermoleophilia bacterium]
MGREFPYRGAAIAPLLRQLASGVQSLGIGRNRVEFRLGRSDCGLSVGPNPVQIGLRLSYSPLPSFCVPRHWIGRGVHAQSELPGVGLIVYPEWDQRDVYQGLDQEGEGLRAEVVPLPRRISGARVGSGSNTVIRRSCSACIRGAGSSRRSRRGDAPRERFSG